MQKHLITLPTAGLVINAMGEDNELHIAIKGIGCIWTWPEFCRVKPPVLNNGSHLHSLIINSPGGRVMTALFINDPAEAEQLAAALNDLKETP